MRKTKGEYSDLCINYDGTDTLINMEDRDLILQCNAKPRKFESMKEWSETRKSVPSRVSMYTTHKTPTVFVREGDIRPIAADKDSSISFMEELKATVKFVERVGERAVSRAPSLISNIEEAFTNRMVVFTYFGVGACLTAFVLLKTLIGGGEPPQLDIF